MIQVVFTTSDTFISRAIRYITEEPVSHVALRCGDEVLHSTGKKGGVELTTWAKFCEIYDVQFQTITEGSRKKMHAVAEKHKDASYDYFGLAWLGIRYFFKKFIRINIPKVNLWQLTGMFTCTEFVTKIIDGKEDSLITPYQLYERLNNGKQLDS
jgi:hypothetical protein